MKSDLLQWICCPACKGDLALTVAEGDATTVAEGTLTCAPCGHTYPIVRGVPRFVAHDGYVKQSVEIGICRIHSIGSAVGARIVKIELLPASIHIATRVVVVQNPAFR